VSEDGSFNGDLEVEYRVGIKTDLSDEEAGLLDLQG